MRVLVTGGAGYVGSVTVETLAGAGHHVVVLDDFSTGHRGAVTPGVRLVGGRYADTAAVAALLGEERIEAVLHCAALAVVPDSVADPARYYRENVAGGIGLLDAVRRAGVRRFVFSSSAAVYGLPEHSPIPESEPPRPVNPYGETKRVLEGALRWYGEAFGLRSVSLRYFNVAGASSRFGEVHDPETHLVPNLLRAVEGGPELVVFGDDYPTPDGTCIRDYVHVVDLADAHLRALEATAVDDLRTGPPSGAVQAVVCNLGSGGGYSVRQILAAAERVLGRPVPHRIGPRRAGDPPILVADIARAAEMLGWYPANGALDSIIGSAWSWRAEHRGAYAV